MERAVSPVEESLLRGGARRPCKQAQEDGAALGVSSQLCHVADAIKQAHGGGPPPKQATKPLRSITARVGGVEGEEDAVAAKQASGHPLHALVAFALLTTGATQGDAGAEMLEEYNRLLNIFILIAGILAGFSLVWAAITIMWGEPDNPHQRGRAKGAVIGAISGLVLVLLAKGLMVLLVDSTTVLLPTR